MEKILAFIERLYNSILYNGFYIILSFLFPFIIYQLSAGHEIIQNIMDENIGLNISLIMFSFFLLAFSVWCVPTIALPVWKFFMGNKTKNEILYNYLTTIYSGAGTIENSNCTNEKIHLRLQIPIKYFAVFPWMLFIFTCVQVFSLSIATFFAIVFLILMFYVIDKYIDAISKTYNKWLFKGKKSPSDKKLLSRYSLFILVFLLFIFLPFLIDLIIPCLFQDKFWGYKLLITFNYIQFFAFYTFISYLEKIGKKLDPKTKYKISNYSYIIVMCLSILIIVALYVVNLKLQISVFNPIFVVVTIVAVFIMFFDILFTSQLLLTHIAYDVRPSCTNKDCAIQQTDKKSLQVYKWVIYLLIPVFIYFTFFHSINKHYIREVTTETDQVFTDKRESFDNYFKKWLDKRGYNNATTNQKEPLNIFLISGPGGGSRAAVWFYLGMKKLDSIYGDKFYKNTFSISTVSGSTSGANMYLAEKYLLEKDFKFEISKSNQLARKIYSKNYFSSTFFGLLIGDGLEGVFTPKVDRNYYFQKEEMNAFSDAYKLNDKATTEANRYFEKDYMYAYQHSNIPLFLINTSLVNYGKRGIFSPVKLKNISLGVDLYSNYVTSCCRKGFGIPMVACVNQSQAFPIINSYNYLDGAGRLCDGGLYDNSGCTTTLEFYQAIKKYIKKNDLTNIRIVCLNIINGKISNDFCPEYKSSSILNTLTGVAEVLFSGHETYAYYNLQRQIKNYNNNFNSNCEKLISKDTSLSIEPIKKYNLTRMLSKVAIDSINSEMNRKIIQIKNSKLLFKILENK